MASEIASPQPYSSSKRNQSLLDTLITQTKLAYYQYEVTFSAYVLTPGEKYVLNTLVILFLSLVGYGIVAMLPRFVLRAASYVFWVFLGTKEKAVSQVLRLNTTSSSWDLIAPGALR